MIPEVDLYLLEGCGRCNLGGTPACKVHTWEEELRQLRRIVLGTGMQEVLKWSVPCYTWDGKNVLIISAFKDYAAISFFKGVLLKDHHKCLHTPGKNSQASRVLKFTNLNQVLKQEAVIEAYVQEAIEVEKAGLKVEFKKPPAPMPQEFQLVLQENPALNAAFEALTPGRQRGYILYFSAPKQSKTRFARIEKYTPKILKGKGFHDR
ncbi:MAG: YdeI/OmpD-associated family protein [Saprospiraceae bacterium]|nr:YdeI/OmpD-associated family protein [Saprospiraceae bacterium]